MPEFIPWKKVAGFMAELRDVGFEAKYLIRRAIGEENERKKQFIIAMLASKQELLHNNLSAITEYRKYLLECNDNAAFQASGRYILHERIITLLNAPWHHKHGEARLLDSDGKILNEVLQESVDRNEDNYLAKMRESFNLQFGNDKTPILLIFSYFIPCTLEEHQCARVIDEYAKRNSETIFVAYQTVFRETDSHTALEQMVDKKVKVVPRKSIIDSVDTECRRLLATSHQRNLDADRYCLPKGWLPKACEVDDSVYKQLARKAHKIEKQDCRKFEDSMPYRVCKNRRKNHICNKTRWCLSDDCDDYN